MVLWCNGTFGMYSGWCSTDVPCWHNHLASSSYGQLLPTSQMSYDHTSLSLRHEHILLKCFPFSLWFHGRRLIKWIEARHTPPSKYSVEWVQQLGLMAKVIIRIAVVRVCCPMHQLQNIWHELHWDIGDVRKQGYSISHSERYFSPPNLTCWTILEVLKMISDVGREGK